MRVRLLGGLGVDGAAERELGSRKGRTLLKVLALARGSAVPTDRLAEVLWGDDQPARPADQVGVLVSRLRGVLGADRVPRTDGGYALVADWLDIDEVATLGEVAAAALAEGRIGAARAAADAALDLARGPLLADEEGEWIEAERAAAAALVARVRSVAIDAAVAAGDNSGAAALAEQALAHDRYDETALRALMRAHLAVGRPASALAAYARVRRDLAEDLGVPPTAATEELHAAALAAADGDQVGVPQAAPAAEPVHGLVGRTAELERLDVLLATAARGAPALVVVEGEAGIGKTTLVDAFAQRAAATGAVVLRGRCDELGRDLPLQPVVDALAEHLRAVGPERAAAVVADSADVLAPLLGPVAGSTATVVADADAGRARLFAALVGALARAADGSPLILVVEDLHVAGPATRSWLAFARPRAAGTVLVATARPGGAAGLDPDARLELHPLTRADVAELVGEERADELHARSAGHPLLLAALAASPPSDELPASVRDAVALRVDSLGEAAAATVRVAAVLGEECDVDLVAQVAGLPIPSVLEHLEHAARAGLVVERGAGFAFAHDLVRQALDAATGAARRALVHQQAARALAARPDPDVLAVAVHARQGGDTVLAAGSFVTAAEAAVARFDVDAAESHLAAAIELAPSAAAYAARARVRMSCLALDDAGADAERAVALGGGAQALEVAGWVAYYRRRYDQARAFADEAVERSDEPAVRVSALALGGRVRHGVGDLAGAVERLGAVRDGPAAVRGVADVWLAQARLHQGRPIDALEALARPMVDPDGLAHPWAPLHLRFNRVMALGQLGRVAEALAAADELDAAVRRSGAVGRRFAAAAANVRAWVLRWSGCGELADEANEYAVEVTGGAGGPAGEAMAEGHYVALLDLADGALLRGDAAGAAAVAERLAKLSLATWSGTMAWHQRHRFGLLRARLALGDGDRELGATLARSVAADAAARGAGRYELLASAVVGLADESVPVERLAPVIEGLGRCAVLDGWPLVAALAAARRADRWQAVAEERAASVVAAAGDQADHARRHVGTVLASSGRERPTP